MSTKVLKDPKIFALNSLILKSSTPAIIFSSLKLNKLKKSIKQIRRRHFFGFD